MEMDFPNSATLLQNAIDTKSYDKLIQQLKKDFGLANIPIDLSNEIVPDKLKTFLHEKIYFLIMEKFSEYLNLLYVVDVPEKAFKEMEVIDVVQVSERVSFLILKRVMQKVWLKEKYSS
jgi:hypothetical protein